MREPQVSGQLKRLHMLSEGTIFFWTDSQGDHHGYRICDRLGKPVMVQEALAAPGEVAVIEQDREHAPLLLNADLAVTIDLTPADLAEWWMTQWQVSREIDTPLIGFSAFGPDGKMPRRPVEALPVGSLVFYSFEGRLGYGFIETREEEGLNRLQMMWLEGPNTAISPIVVADNEQVALDLRPADLAYLYMQAHYITVNSHPVLR